MTKGYNRRVKNGYLSLDIPETEIILDENGIPVDIRPYEINFANEIIEQFMLIANETVAEKFFWLEAPFIYRVHEYPEEEKIRSFLGFVSSLGYHVNGNIKDVKPTTLQGILKQLVDKPEYKILSSLLLRSMKKAIYSPEK